jgi:hypothetical protein
MEDGSLAAIGCSFAIVSARIYGVTDELLPPGSVSYNTELVKKFYTRNASKD